MSACWVSDLRARCGALARALAALALLAVALPDAAAAQSREVRRITVSDEGVEVAEGDSAARVVTRRGRGVVRIVPGSIHVEEGAGSTLDVNIPGPIVVVDGAESGLVRVFADAEVRAGERVEGDVVAVFGSVDVAGAVAGDVVAVFGSVRLTPGALVEGDVVAIGGVLDHAEGATVNGQSVSLGFFPVTWGLPTLPVLLAVVLAGWLLAMLGAWFLALVFPERLLRVAATASRHTAGSFFLGVASVPLSVLAVALLFITVIGIPFAFLLPPAYLVVIWAGQLAASYVLGSKLVRRPLGRGGPLMPIAAGTLFVALFFVAGAALAGPPGLSRTVALFLTLLGVLLVCGLSAIGTGAFLLSRAGARPADVRFAAPGTVPAAPPAGAAYPPPA